MFYVFAIICLLGFYGSVIIYVFCGVWFVFCDLCFVFCIGCLYVLYVWVMLSAYRASFPISRASGLVGWVFPGGVVAPSRGVAGVRHGVLQMMCVCAMMCNQEFSDESIWLILINQRVYYDFWLVLIILNHFEFVQPQQLQV